jgi:hypothetical protein
VVAFIYSPILFSHVFVIVQMAMAWDGSGKLYPIYRYRMNPAMTLRKFYTAVAPVLGLGETATRELGRAIYRVVDGAAHDTRPVATTLNAAHMVIGAIAGGTQRQAGDRVQRLFAIEADGGIDADVIGTRQHPKFCQITGAAMFGDAVFTILHRPEIAAQIARVEVQAGADDAWIVATDGRTTHFFGERADAGRPDVRTVASITGEGLSRVASLIAVG